MEEKTLIQNGTVIDGTGAKPKKESILIDKCNIKATGEDADKIAVSNDVIKICLLYTSPSPRDPM